MIAAAFLFTSIQNYSYSFDRNPMESEVEKEECDDSQEDEGDGTANMKKGYSLTIIGCIDFPFGPLGPSEIPGLNKSESGCIRCCIKTSPSDLCNSKMQENVKYCHSEPII